MEEPVSPGGGSLCLTGERPVCGERRTLFYATCTPTILCTAVNQTAVDITCKGEKQIINEGIHT